MSALVLELDRAVDGSLSGVGATWSCVFFVDEIPAKPEKPFPPLSTSDMSCPKYLTQLAGLSFPNLVYGEIEDMNVPGVFVAELHTESLV